MKTTIGIDPVCNERVYAEDAVKFEVRGEIRWFCSGECAARFADAPWRFEDEEYHDRTMHDPVLAQKNVV